MHDVHWHLQLNNMKLLNILWPRRVFFFFNPSTLFEIDKSLQRRTVMVEYEGRANTDHIYQPALNYTTLKESGSRLCQEGLTASVRVRLPVTGEIKLQKRSAIFAEKPTWALDLSKSAEISAEYSQKMSNLCQWFMGGKTV